MSKRVHNKKQRKFPKHWPSGHRTKVRAPDRPSERRESPLFRSVPPGEIVFLPYGFAHAN